MTSKEKRLRILNAENILNESALAKVEKRMLEIKVSSDEWSDLASKRNCLIVDMQVAEKKMYYAEYDKPYLGSNEIQGEDVND